MSAPKLKVDDEYAARIREFMRKYPVSIFFRFAIGNLLNDRAALLARVAELEKQVKSSPAPCGTGGGE